MPSVADCAITVIFLELEIDGFGSIKKVGVFSGT